MAFETPVSVPGGNNKNRVCRVKTRVLEEKTTRNMHKQGVGGAGGHGAGTRHEGGRQVWL
jgi:hypothetical protein